MMTFNFISARGDILPLTDNDDFWLTNINGQTTATSSISSSAIGGVDGDTVNNIQAQPRTIIFDLHIKSGVNVESAKRRILQYIKLKKNCTLRWEQNGKTVEIKGIVESVDMPRWTNSATMQVTMHCSHPFWEDAEYIISQINEAIGLHFFTDYQNDMLYFPASGIPFGEYDTTRSRHFYNEGDVEVGLEIEILAFDTVTNPIIYDSEWNFFGCGYGTGTKQIVMESGDKIVITTSRGKKSVTLNGVSIFDKIKPQSTWLQLNAGDNQFAINSDDESLTNMTFTLSYKQKYI